MPRGVKRQIDFDEEINKIDMKITRWTNTIKELQEEKRKLEDKKKKKELSALYNIIQSSGLSVAEVVERLQQTNSNDVA